MVDANTGELIWKNNREDDPVWSHGHIGWTADIWDKSPGMEAVSNRQDIMTDPAPVFFRWAKDIGIVPDGLYPG